MTLVASRPISVRSVQYADTILDLARHTPLVRLPPRDGRPRPARPQPIILSKLLEAQPWRLGEGADRAAHDQGCRTLGPAAPGRHHHRADLRQQRPRPRDHGGDQGPSQRLRDGRQAIGREAGPTCGRTARTSSSARQMSRRTLPRATTRLRPGWSGSPRAPGCPANTGTTRTPPHTKRRPAGVLRADRRAGRHGSRGGAHRRSRADGGVLGSLEK
jgi:hypothetical protein